jgi:drug/metabolite transporter (DMT)-like permease
MSKQYYAHLSLFLVNLLYGASHIIAKGVMPTYLTPNVFILFRAVGATILFWLISSFMKSEKIARTDVPRLIACGLFGVAMNQLFFFHGLNLSSAINSGIIMTINPILVFVLSYFFLKEAVTVKKIIGVSLGAIGAILLTLTAGTGEGDSILGDFFLFINAVSYAIYLIIAKPLMKRYKPFTVIMYTFTFGTAFICLFPPTIPDLLQTNFLLIEGVVWGKIIYVVVGVTFLTYLLTMFGLKYLSPAISSSYIYFQPIMVMLFAFIFSWIGFTADYTNTISFQKVLYMLLIFLGVFLLSSSKIKRSKS